MTLLEKCRELYPDGKLDKHGLPIVCPWMVKGLNADREHCGDEPCKDCWNREYKEAKDEKN